MGLVTRMFKKSLLSRNDKDGIIPYLSHEDFPNLHFFEYTFKNSKGYQIHYYLYYYDNYIKDKVILFCPGLGPGHTAYIREIEEYAKRGYMVYSLDYTGTDKSEGESMISIYQPTRDVMELIDLLSLKEEIVLIGHSLGGFTSLNVARLRKDINKVVCMSMFLSIDLLLKGIVKAKLLRNIITKDEYKHNPDLAGDNIEFLKNTDKKLLMIQSKDDQVVLYENALGLVNDLNNPNITTKIVEGRGHNPNYSDDAFIYMNNTFAEYNRLIKEKKLVTYEQKKAYMSDKSALLMTEQDHEITSLIMDFIK